MILQPYTNQLLFGSELAITDKGCDTPWDEDKLSACHGMTPAEGEEPGKDAASHMFDFVKNLPLEQQEYYKVALSNPPMCGNSLPAEVKSLDPLTSGPPMCGNSLPAEVKSLDPLTSGMLSLGLLGIAAKKRVERWFNL